MLRLGFSGSTGDNDITQTNLALSCSPGPLKDLIESPLNEPPPGSGVSSWAALFDDARLSVTLTPGGRATASGVGGVRLLTGPNRFRVTHASGAVVVELRYHPTAVR